MIVDSSAVIAILLPEDDAARFSRAIQGAVALSMSMATYVESSIVITSRKPDAPAFQELDRMIQNGRISLEPVSLSDALEAREAFAKFGKGRHAAKLNFGDCFTYALARRLNRPILCKGDDFALTDAGIVPLA